MDKENNSKCEGDEVVIIGIGFRSKLKNNGKPSELWDQLLNGYDDGSETSEIEFQSFDSKFFGINSNEIIDQQQKLMLKCVWEALEDSLIDPFEIRGTNTSVYTSCSTIDHDNDVKQTTSNRISNCFDLCGESVTIDNSYPLNSFKLGYQSIKSGLSKISITGNVTLKNEKPSPIDTKTDECGIIVMKSLKQALIDGNNIYCVINDEISNFNEQNIESNSCASSLIKCCLMFKHQCFLPTNNIGIKFNDLDINNVTEPILFSDIINKRNQNENKPITISINGLSDNGLNISLILSELINGFRDIQTPSNQQYLIPFSANSNTSLEKYQSLIRKYEIDFNEFVKQQLHKSTKLLSRSVVIASNWDEFDESLANQIKTKNNNNKFQSNIQIAATKGDPTIVFVFCGQGTHYPTIAKQLYETEPIFRQSMDEMNISFSKYFGYSIIDKLRSFDENDLNSLYSIFPMTMSAIGIIQASLFKLYTEKYGIKPSFIIGHSFGEFVAPYCAGMIDLDTLSKISYYGSTEQSKTMGTGGLLSITIGKDEFINKYSSKYPKIEIACYNSPSSIVIGGDYKSLKLISIELKNDGILSTMVGSAPFHTSKQIITKQPMLNDIKFDPKPSEILMFSTITSHLFGDHTTPFYDPEYVSELLCKSVKFEQTISNLYKHIENEKLSKDIVFIEIAPHPTLTYYLKQMVPSSDNEYFKNSSISFYSPLSKKSPNDSMEIKKMVSQLYCQGYNHINFKNQFENLNCTNDNLPLYQWDDDNYETLDIESVNDIILNDEELILNKISELLSMDSNKIKQDLRLIEYGANSLQVVQLKNFTQSQFPLVPNIITIQQIQNNTIGSIIKMIKIELDKIKLEPKKQLKPQTMEERIEYWKNEMKLDDSMIQKVGNINTIQNNDDKRVLLTGSTGFFGAYVLSKLLALSSCSIVYCLIRNKSKSLNPIDEIISNLKYHQLYDQFNHDQLSKISVIVGDLALNKFGLSDNDFINLSTNINLIINSGADIDLESDYETCKPVNVNGVKELVKLSILSYPPIKIVSFSTYFIFLNQEYQDDHGEFDEDTVLPLIENIDNLKKGYLQSKVVGEYLLKKSSESFKIPIMIIRLPSIYSNPNTGIGSKFDLPQLILLSCYAVGHYPLLSNYICISSITWTASNSMNLILNDNCWIDNSTVVYGVYGESQQNLLDSAETLIDNKTGNSLQISFEEWKQLILNSNDKSCILLKTFHSFEFEHLKIDSRFTISNKTKSLLKSIGNDYGNNDDWKITDQMIINNFNYSLKQL